MKNKFWVMNRLGEEVRPKKGPERDQKGLKPTALINTHTPLWLKVKGEREKR